MDLVSHRVAVFAQLLGATLHRFTQEREHFRIVLEKMNLNMSGGAEVEKAIANGRRQRPSTGPWVKEAKCSWRFQRQETRHEPTDFWRGEELAFSLPRLKRGESLVSRLQVERIRQQWPTSGIYRA